MDNEMDDMAKKIINRTIYLIYMLTGEEYMLVRQAPNDQIFGNLGSGGRKRTHIPSQVRPIENNTAKIREVNNQVTQLLSGKFPVRSEDSPITFSEDEWEYLEGRKDFYNAILKNKYRHLQDLPRESATEDLETLKKKILQRFLEASSQTQLKGAENGTRPMTSSPFTFTQSLPDLPTEQNIRNQEFFKSPPQNQSFGLNAPVFAPVKFPERFSCEVCGKSFPQKKNLNIHKKIHSFPFTQSGYGAPQEYRPSQTSHTLARMYPCPECDLNFGQESSLEMHMKGHEPTEFPCLECGEIFKTNALLSQHQSNATVGQMYTCDVCRKIFIYSKCLLYHAKTHRGQTKFPCLQCGKILSSKNNLIKHYKSHKQHDSSSDGDDETPAPPTEQ